MTLFASLLLVSANDFLLFYLAFELQSFSFYILAASKKDSLLSTEAGLKYFVQGSFASGLLLFGVALLYGTLGSINFNDLRCFNYSRFNPCLSIVGSFLFLNLNRYTI